MKLEKQIKKMADDISSYIHKKEKRTMLIITDFETSVHRRGLSKHLIEQGYRKVEQGEWREDGRCSNCEWYMPFDCEGNGIETDFCPYCGAYMKGAE